MNHEREIDFENLTPAAQRILDTASNLFYRQGINSVGVDTIAREANVTKKTIYDRFHSKDELIAAYLARRDRRWRDLIQQRVETPGSSARDRILAMFDIMEDETRERGCGFINALAELSEEGNPARELARDQKAWTLHYFVELAREAGAIDPEALGAQLLMLHEGAYIAYSTADIPVAAQLARDAAGTLIDSAVRNA